jgi:Kunitz/Bovine pancreatic trypsin inhibitor domain
MPVVIGDCFEQVTRWYYNITVEKCVQFIYSGCDGNENNFDTESECQVNCEVRGLGE